MSATFNTWDIQADRTNSSLWSEQHGQSFNNYEALKNLNSFDIQLR